MDKALLRALQAPLLVNPVRNHSLIRRRSAINVSNGVKIGPIEIPTRIFLAPMAGCTDLAFRLISREHGARFCFFEMIDANCVIHKNIAKHHIINTCDADMPIAAQLLGSDPAIVCDAAAKLLDQAKVPFLDLNFACPVKKVIRKKAGAFLLRDADALCRIIKKLSDSVGIPVTAKIRAGFDKYEPEELSTLAKKMRESGASAIFVHGRTAKQIYSGSVDYNPIKTVKDSVDIPVFGSGDVFSPELAGRMLDRTGCDGVMIARGALGNPWIFSQTEEYLDSGKLPEQIDMDKRKEVLKKHLSYMERYCLSGRPARVGPMRKTALWYIKRFSGAAKTRSCITAAKSFSELVSIVDDIPTC